MVYSAQKIIFLSLPIVIAIEITIESMKYLMLRQDVRDSYDWHDCSNKSSQLVQLIFGH